MSVLFFVKVFFTLLGIISLSIMQWKLYLKNSLTISSQKQIEETVFTIFRRKVLKTHCIFLLHYLTVIHSWKVGHVVGKWLQRMTSILLMRRIITKVVILFHNFDFVPTLGQGDKEKNSTWTKGKIRINVITWQFWYQHVYGAFLVIQRWKM